MATANIQIHKRPVAIAPVPSGASSINLVADGDSSQPTKPYSCQTCARRKVKCDKATPICSTCLKAKLECFYQAPPPRSRKRKLSGDINERLARYERILLKHGLLPQDAHTPSSVEETPQEPISIRWNEIGPSGKGKLLAGQSKSRYIDSNLWGNLEEVDLQYSSDEDEEDHMVTGIDEGFTSDPLTGAFLGFQQSLLQYHPAPAEAIMLWTTHIENVEPLCKIVHIPSISEMVKKASQQPKIASKIDECLLFAIYHFAVFSMTEEECKQKLGQSRITLMQRYNFATRQALVNASFLKTTEMPILQALVLFLLPCRYFYDPHTYWILTGVALRIAQRIGLHRDGEKLGLPPFEVQMRRRLFYQLIPLDGIASYMTGTGIAVIPDKWDTQQPLNISDDQIWPGMTETPKESKSATEMIFCLSRYSIGKFLIGKSDHGVNSGDFNDYNSAETMISEVETLVEEKYIRYCDILNPLHFLTMALARAGITAMRLRLRLPKVKNQTVTDAERKEMFHLSQKIIDTDTATFANTSLRKYRWHMRPFFLWGTWDSLILVVTSLCMADFLKPEENDAAWSRLEQVYSNHSDLLESKRVLSVAFGRVTLRAWEASPPSNSVPEPAYIITLRSLRKGNVLSRAERQDSTPITLDAQTDITTPFDASSARGVEALFNDLPGNISINIGNDFNIDTADWKFWDQLIQDYQTQSDLEADVFSQ